MSKDPDNSPSAGAGTAGTQTGPDAAGTLRAGLADYELSAEDLALFVVRSPQ